MDKIFNIKHITRELNKNYFYWLEAEDIISNFAFKKTKERFNSKHRIDYLNKFLSKEKFNVVVQRFFPSKYDSLQDSDWNTLKFFYSDEDEKVHWVVIQNENERHFKLKTEEIFSRTDEEIKEVCSNIKKILDRFYGYWLYKENDDWYITDKNKIGENWRIIADKNNNYSKNFGDFENLNDLVVL